MKKNTTKNITVPNRDLEFLKKHFSHCFDKNGNFDFEKFKQELSENEINFSKESYGMDWLGKSYARLLASDEATTILKEDEEFNQKEENKDSDNLLIKGDNLEVLKHLSNAYYEKVKMIYIDPPYNTGSDGFVYQDDRKFTKEELSKLAGIDEDKAKRILDFTQSKSNSHSAWLTFMYPRLYIAKQLLKNDGVIFVSIDDNEVAQLRLLMDEIFGEENFVGEIIWENKEGGGSSDSKHFRIKHEYLIVYGKNKENVEINGLDVEDRDRYKLMDKHEKERGKYQLIKLNSASLGYIKSLDYPIESPDGTLIYPNKNNEKISRWRWSEEKLKLGIENDFVVIKKDKNGDWVVYTKQYLKVDKDGNIIDGRKIQPLGVISKFSTTQSNKYIKSLFNDKAVFGYSKPVNYIKFILQISTNQNDLILDFFAGSGTTGDAVMQLNAEDGGNRKYILVQLPEKIDKKKNKTAYDFVKEELKVEKPTIFEITKERIIRSAKKTVKDNEELKEKDKKDLSKQDFGFKIFETISNDEGVWEDYNFEAEEFDEQQKLFDESKLSDEDLKTLLTTWKTYDGIALTKSLQEIDLDGYIGNYFDNKLYLINTGFEIKNLKKLLEEIDSNKDFNPAIIIAFGYNFESKNLREIAENIKSYANKKQIDIDFITRY
ncbi:MAG: site-specific DNA-methyltransferase [Methanosarcinales archaeon]|nr:site-specific DNA-methyltransferase [Methanosarcinales archaeon]